MMTAWKDEMRNELEARDRRISFLEDSLDSKTLAKEEEMKRLKEEFLVLPSKYLLPVSCLFTLGHKI